MSPPTSRLWAITAYFNPFHYATRLKNYRTFRSRLKLPLVAVEQLGNGPPELTKADAEILVRVPAGSVLWQKERLLNVGFAYIPPQADAVVALDCDLIFESDQWVHEVHRVLQSVPAAQCYSELVHLPRHWDGAMPAEGALSGQSIARLVQKKRPRSEFFSSEPNGAANPGSAWAFRRDLITEHGLYDAMVLGGGDRLFAYACLGWFEDAIALARLGPQRAMHYLAWARPLYQRCRGSIGVIEGRLLHLWHGSLHHRSYLDRHDALEHAGFDPDLHLTIGPGGAWEWTSSTPAGLRSLALNYLRNRLEDG
jgi:hypothetical protein